MNSEVIGLFLAGGACCFVIGLCLGLMLRLRSLLQGDSRESSAEVAQLQADVQRWEDWYADHFPRCALLEESNRQGRSVLNELSAGETQPGMEILRAGAHVRSF